MIKLFGHIKSRLYIFSIMLILIPCLVSCSGGIDRDAAKIMIGEFFDAVETEDYEKAETYLHPDLTDDLQEFFVNAEDKLNLDFQSGIVIEKYTGFSYSFYNSKMDGSFYELTMLAKVGEQTVTFTVSIVQNEKGYGIYGLNIK